MTMLLRKQNAQDRIEGPEPFGWQDHDFAVLDGETRIGRMYREQLPAGAKWCWFLQVTGAPPPKSGIADTSMRQRPRSPQRMSGARKIPLSETAQ